MARPPKYNEHIVEEILMRFADGETLTSICSSENMPKRNTVYRWRSQYPEFGQAYLCAQEQHSDALIDKAGEIVDNEPDPQRAKIQADHRKWLAARLNRHKYGEKVEVHHKQIIDISGVLDDARQRVTNLEADDLKLLS